MSLCSINVIHVPGKGSRNLKSWNGAVSQGNGPTGVAFKLIIALVHLNRSSLVCMPVCNYDGEVIGVAQIMNKREGSDDSSAGVGHQFTETDLKVDKCNDMEILFN